jgi:hypothetical protein
MLYASLRRKLRRAKEIRRRQGLRPLLRRGIWFIHRTTIRRILPRTGYYTNAGLPVRERKLLDSIIPGITYSDNPDHEYALISELREHVTPGDRVVVVGAGSGTTTVVAAAQAKESGKVIAFEGALSRVQEARETILLNDVDSRCEIRHEIVGPAIHLAHPNDEPSEANRCPPQGLPDCDVLELDCEGAEEEILQHMEITPRVIIVETHPALNSPPDRIKEILREKGYNLINKQNRKSVPVLTAVQQNHE